MNNTRGLRRPALHRVGVAAATALALVAPLSAPAHAASSDAGLYGAADPTYDGVFRQSLAILGLTANEITPPSAAVDWLLEQQCADGSFEAYRADVTKPCGKPDPVNYSGPDTNSTGLALMALMALDDSRITLSSARVNRVVDAAEAAGTWLRKQQNSDGGWSYYPAPGSASDANSTAVSLAAANTWGGTYGTSRLYKRASRFLGSVASSCADGGGFSYQAGGKPDGLSTSQGVVALAGTLPVVNPGRAAVAAPCASTARAKGVSYLARGLASSGVLESSMGGPDYTATATAVLGLISARQGRAAIVKGTKALKAAAQTYVAAGDDVNPGAAGLLLMVADATGNRATSFGGLNLVTTLNGSIRR